MPRTCSVCTSERRDAIDKALVDGAAYRTIAQRFAASPAAVLRHKQGSHVAQKLAKAEDAKQVAAATDLLGELRTLRGKAYQILVKADAGGDLRTAIMAIREARSCLELLAELEGELDRRPQVNLLVAPEWLQVRAVVLEALGPYPDARAAVAGRLRTLELVS